METYYDVLGVSAQSSLDEIKAAHRSLARVLHPDKNPAPDSVARPPLCCDGDEYQTKTGRRASFLKVQEAWECLRDSSRRKKYDESLSRKKELSDAKAQKAVEVRLSTLDCEVCDIESDDEEESQPSGIGARLSTQKVFLHHCRCGDCFEILEEDLFSREGGRMQKDSTSKKQADNVWECQSCSLGVKFIVDMQLGNGTTD